ncbi:MAG: hypothetical protein WA957_12330 [Alteraurantiacibacter sp.]
MTLPFPMHEETRNIAAQITHVTSALPSVKMSLSLALRAFSSPDLPSAKTASPGTSIAGSVWRKVLPMLWSCGLRPARKFSDTGTRKHNSGMQARVKGRITYRAAYQNWQLALEARNLTDKLYYIDVFDNRGSTRAVNGTPGMPPTLALTLRYNFA